MAEGCKACGATWGRLRRKQDPFGRDVPTQLPRSVPSSQVRFPEYNRTAEFPRSIVDPRDAEELINEAINNKKGELARWLFSTWNANRRDLKFEEIYESFQGVDFIDPDGALERFRRNYNKTIVRNFQREWFGTAARGGALVANGLGLGGVASDDPYSLSYQSHLDQWVRERGAEFVTNATALDRRALRAVFRKFTVQESIGPREAARFLRPMIGLTPRQAAGVWNLYDGWRADGIPESEARRKAETVAARRMARRAETIARTELASAFNYGGFYSVKAAFETGALADTGDVVEKRWFTQLDERVCPFCGPLHGQLIPMNATFPGLTDALPNIFVPPAHPNCRCVILYEVTEADDVTGIGEIPDQPDDEDKALAIIDDELTSLRSRFPWLPEGPEGPVLDPQRRKVSDDEKARRLGSLRQFVADELGGIDFDKPLDFVQWDKAKRGEFEGREVRAFDSIQRDSTDAANLIARGLGDTTPTEVRAYKKSIRANSGRSNPTGKPVTNVVRVNVFDSRRTVFHEFGHHMSYGDENRPNAVAATAFKRRRVEADGSELRKLSDITGNKKFRDDERAYEDRFISAYVGKGKLPERGGADAGEVLAVGVEQFSSTNALYSLALRDPEHFALTVATLKGRFVDRQQSASRRLVDEITAGDWPLSQDESWLILTDELGDLRRQFDWLGEKPLTKDEWEAEQMFFFAESREASDPDKLAELEAEYRRRRHIRTDRAEKLARWRESLIRDVREDIDRPDAVVVETRASKKSQKQTRDAMEILTLAGGGEKWKAGAVVSMRQGGPKVRAKMGDILKAEAADPNETLDDVYLRAFRRLATDETAALDTTLGATFRNVFRASLQDDITNQIRYGYFPGKDPDEVNEMLLRRWGAKLGDEELFKLPDGRFSAMALPDDRAVEAFENIWTDNDRDWFATDARNSGFFTEDVLTDSGMRRSVVGGMTIKSAESEKTINHEVTHYVDSFNGRAADAAQMFLKRRHERDGKGVRKLSEITGNPKFRNNEVADEDTFLSPYIGKIYPWHNATEVHSVGVEKLLSANPSDLYQWARRDPEHFAQIVALVRGRFGYRQVTDPAKWPDGRGKP